MSRMRHVAVLGSGIMGSATALYLARRGVRVMLFDASKRPFEGASRWNEGKIHLGCLYSASGSLKTAEKILPGGLLFKELTEELVGCPIDEAVTDHEDTYLVHRDSVVSADVMHRYLGAVTEMAAKHPDANRYLRPLGNSRVQRVPQRELEACYDTQTVLAGYRVPERSVSTVWLADRFVEALLGEPFIKLALETRVRAVRQADGRPDGRLFVETGRGSVGPFDAVVNALWEGRLAVDNTLGIIPDREWSHRFRLSVFLRTVKPLGVPSAVIAVGPFGDLKNYNQREFYLSWYPAGLLAEGYAIEPPEVPLLGAQARSAIVEDVFAHLGRMVYGVEEIKSSIESLRLQGGWVYAAGQGSLADPAATLHRRDRVGFVRSARYLSVDTGKYSIAPWLARSIAALLLEG